MNNAPPKYALLLAITVGGYVGEYIPSLFGAGYFSMWGILGSVVGALLALWLTWKAYTVWF